MGLSLTREGKFIQKEGTMKVPQWVSLCSSICIVNDEPIFPFVDTLLYK